MASVFVLNAEKVVEYCMEATKATKAKMFGQSKTEFNKVVGAIKRKAKQCEVRRQVAAYLEAKIFEPFCDAFRNDFLRAVFFLLFRPVGVMTAKKEATFFEVLLCYVKIVRLYLNYGQRPPLDHATFQECFERVLPNNTDKITDYMKFILEILADPPSSDPSKLWQGKFTTEMLHEVLNAVGSKPCSVRTFRKYMKRQPASVEVVATLTLDQRLADNLAVAVQNKKLVDLSVREDTVFVDLTF